MFSFGRKHGGAGGGPVVRSSVAPIGAGITDLTLAGLNGDLDLGYDFQFHVVNGSASNRTLSFRVNGAGTNVTGWQIANTAAGGAILGTTGASGSMVDFIAVPANGNLDFFGKIHAKSGSVRQGTLTISQWKAATGICDGLYTVAFSFSDTAANITSLSLHAAVASAIDVGSAATAIVCPYQ